MTNNAYAKNNGDGLLCSILWLVHARAPCARVKISTRIFGLPMLIYAMKVEMKVSVRYSQYRPPLSVINISIIK